MSGNVNDPAPTADVPPTPAPADTAPAPAPTPAPTPPVPAPPTESSTNKEVLDAISGLTEIVTKLLNKDAGVPSDTTPVKRPWTQWGSR